MRWIFAVVGLVFSVLSAVAQDQFILTCQYKGKKAEFKAIVDPIQRLAILSKIDNSGARHGFATSDFSFPSPMLSVIVTGRSEMYPDGVWQDTYVISTKDWAFTHVNEIWPEGMSPGQRPSLAVQTGYCRT